MHCSCHALTKHTVQQQHSARHIQKGMVMLFNKRAQHSPPPQPLLYTHLGCTDGSCSDGAPLHPEQGNQLHRPPPHGRCFIYAASNVGPHRTHQLNSSAKETSRHAGHTRTSVKVQHKAVSLHTSTGCEPKAHTKRTQHHPGPFKSTGRMLECLATRYRQCPHHSYIFN